MTVIAERMQEVRPGEPQAHRNLTLVPLLAPGPETPGYRLLDQALAAGCARVTEVSESGSVPELRFVNECDRPVLLLDGEELVGAKQNRILNLSVLVPAHETIVIPVSCVEAGRWQAESAEFSSAGRTHYAAGRARKAAQVSESLRTAGSWHSDQAAVWQDISAKAARMDAPSDTEAAAALYERHRASLDGYLQAFQPVEGQAGALFLIDGKVAGLDLFDSPATLSAVLPKLVESYALDALDTKGTTHGANDPGTGAFLERVSGAGVERFPAVGEGEDLRLQGEDLTGGALVDGERVLHLCAFPLAKDRSAGGGRRSHMVRASWRGRGSIRE